MPSTAANHEPGLGFPLSDLGRLLRCEYDRRVQQEGLGLTRAQWLILRQVSEHEGCRQRELAEVLRIEASTVGRHVERLVAAGWLERRDDAWDGRAYRLHLQPKARNTLARLKRLTVAWRDEYFAGIAPERREALIDDLQIIKHNVLARRVRTESRPPDHAIPQEIQSTH
jgi:DNA-binding MarR family transcriptional regulator